MIHINTEKKEFHLRNQKISYVFRVMEQLEVLGTIVLWQLHASL